MTYEEVYCDSTWLVEYTSVEGGLLLFENLLTGELFTTGIRSTETGRCVVRGQFKDCLAKYGIDRTVKTFRQLKSS